MFDWFFILDLHVQNTSSFVKGFTSSENLKNQAFSQNGRCCNSECAGNRLQSLKKKPMLQHERAGKGLMMNTLSFFVLQRPAKKMPRNVQAWSETTLRNEQDGSVSIEHKFVSINNNEELHPIACSNCRKLHKRCGKFFEWAIFMMILDRKKPSCSKCISKGLTCSYTEQRKKGRKSKKASVDENNSPPQTEPVRATKSNEAKTLGQPYQAIDYTTMLQSIRTNIVDAYHDVVSLGCPLIPRDELLHLVYSPDEVSKRKDILAFLISIQVRYWYQTILTLD